VDIPLKNDMRVLLIPKLRLDSIHIIARSSVIRQSKTILARFLQPGRWLHRLVERRNFAKQNATEAECLY
jgi:hypothetical protein